MSVRNPILLDNPQRLEIQKRMSAALKEISIANGYKVDLDENVFRGRLYFGSNDPIPMVAVLEVPIPLDQTDPPLDAVLSNGPWELMIQGWAKDDKENPTDPAHVLMADVKKRLAIEKAKADRSPNPADGLFGLGRLVTDMQIGQGVVRPPDDVSAKAYFWLTVTLDLAEDLEQPYEA